MKVLVTGSNGFIAKNLIANTSQDNRFIISTYSRKNNQQDLFKLVNDSDAVVHLAGANRPESNDYFFKDNIELTVNLCQCLESSQKKTPIIFSSTTQSNLDNPYGKSKLEAEKVIKSYGKKTGSKVHIYRLPNVFGKWAKPNYNSVVATFCHNIAGDLPIVVDDPGKELDLVYIDDLIKEFVSILISDKSPEVEPPFPVYSIKLGQLAELIKSFRQSRINLTVGSVGSGLTRALYATYLSYYKPSHFSYKLKQHNDDRGGFAEFLKTQDSGQISFFTVNPGCTRGGHFHHTKNEKFLVVKGNAKFRFRNILTNEKYELDVNEDLLEVVETIPGWVHDISNLGTTKMIVMLWANEIFNEKMPDTYSDVM